MSHARARSGARDRGRAAARALVTGLAVLAVTGAACLRAGPPKTPNQRAAERAAPPVVVPAPPDAGRTPHPAGAP